MSKNVAYNADLNGFIPFERYYFELDGLGGNWPAIVTPVSGYFTTDSDGKYSLSASVSFCAATGVSDCDPNAEGYLDFNSNLLTDLDLYTNLQLNVKDLSNKDVLSQVSKVECLSCRPSIHIEVPTFVNLLKTNDGSADFNVHMDGLEIGETYTYDIESKFGNWPMYVTPISGSFKSYDQTKTLTLTVDACASGTGCASQELLTNYTLDDRDNYYAGFRFVLKDSDNVEDYSSVVEAICDNCLPDAPEIVTVQNGVLTSVSDTLTRNVDIRNLNSNETYYYVVENIVSDHPVILYPQSGVIANKQNTNFELDTVFCGSAGECSASAHYIAANSQGTNYLGSQSKDLTFDITVYKSLNGSVYSDPVVSINNVRTTCDQCVHNPKITLNQNISELTLNNSNQTSLVVGLSNLEIGKQYKYTINNTSATWPTHIAKPSGQFTASASTKTISSTLKFCEATGVCPTTTFDVNDIDYDYQEAQFNATLETLNTDIDDAVSDVLTVICQDCIPDHEIGTISSVAYPNKYENETVSLNDDSYNFSLKFRGLVIGESYDYRLNFSDSNWPLNLQKQSGTFIADDDTVFISNSLRFCPTSNGDCSAHNNTISEIGNLSTKLNDIYADFTVNLSGASTDVNIDSHPVTLMCGDCINKITVNNDTLSDDTYAFTATNLEIGREYYYIVNSGETGNWPFTFGSLSGYFVPDSASHSINIDYSVVAYTGVGSYDASMTLPYSRSQYDTTKYKNVSVTVGSYDVDIRSATSSLAKIVCDNCFADPNVNLNIQLSNVTDAIITGNQLQVLSPIQDVDLIFGNIFSGYKYGYSIESVSSNWPYKLLIDSTGVIESTNQDTSNYNFVLPVEFCATSGGSCFSNRFNTDITSSSDIAAAHENISNTIRVSISGLEGEPLTTNVESQDFVLNCSDDQRRCIRSMSSSIADIQEANTNSQTVIFNSLDSNDPHLSNRLFTYSINSSDVNWPITTTIGTTGLILGKEELVLDLSFCPTVDGQCSTGSSFAFVEDSCEDNNDKHGVFTITYSGYNVDIEPYTTDSYSAICPVENLDSIGVINTSNNNQILTNNTGPSVELEYVATNLSYGEEYGYSFSVNNANWPLELSVYTGTFVATDTEHNLSTELSFCNRSDGTCAGQVDALGLVPYTLNNLDPQSQITLNVSGLNCDIADGLSSSVSVTCSDCLDEIALANISDVILTSDSNFSVNIDLSNFKGFDLDDTYYYEIRRYESNWPINTDQISGTITNQQILSLDLSFCPTSSGECSLDADTFSANPINCKVRNNDKYGIFDILVSGSGLDVDHKISNRFSVTCPANLLDSIDVEAQQNVYNLNSTTSNRVDLSYVMGNLTAGETYRYNITSIDADWPFRILTGNSGNFVASDSTHILDLVGEFCATTGGACSLDSLDYTPTESCLMTFDSEQNPNYSLGLHIDVWGTGCEIGDGMNKNVRLSCSNCLNNVNILEPSDLFLVDTNMQAIYFDITGLKNGKSYTYEFHCDNANWPISMTPHTGTIEAEGSNFTLGSNLMFCYPSGICADKNNVSDYTTYSYYDKITKGTNLIGDMSVTVTPSDECDESAQTSDQVRVTCENCLPAFSYASIVMSGSPEIALPESCCTGSLPVYVNVTDAVPGEAYTYTFSSSSSNIVFNPVSGTAYFDATGQGTLITTVESDLDLYGMGIIQCDLVHNNTNEKVIDMIAIRCGESCPLE